MSIFKRLFKIGQAKANQAVDEIESPELMLDQAIRDKEGEIKSAKQSVAECIATERGTKIELEKERKAKKEWQKKAEQAIAAGKEELAVQALERSDEHESKVKNLEPIWKQQRAGVDDLKSAVVKMENELTEFKRNKDFIIAQSRTAELKKKIYETKAKMNKDSGADDLMARMKAKADRTANEAEAAEEMADTFGGGDKLSDEFAELESKAGSEAMEDRLAALRAKINKE